MGHKKFFFSEVWEQLNSCTTILKICTKISFREQSLNAIQVSVQMYCDQVWHKYNFWPCTPLAPLGQAPSPAVKYGGGSLCWPQVYWQCDFHQVLKFSQFLSQLIDFPYHTTANKKVEKSQESASSAHMNAHDWLVLLNRAERVWSVLAMDS